MRACRVCMSVIDGEAEEGNKLIKVWVLNGSNEREFILDYDGHSLPEGKRVLANVGSVCHMRESEDYK